MADHFPESTDKIGTFLSDAFTFIREDLAKTADLSRATLFRWEASGRHLYALSAVGTEQLVELSKGIATEDSFEYPRSAALKREAVVGNIEDGSWPDALKSYAAAVGITSILSVPVSLEGEVVGVVNFFFAEPFGRQSSQIRNLRALGRIIAQAISGNLVFRIKAERQARHIRSLAHEASNLLKAVEAASEALLYDDKVTMPSETVPLVYHMISNLKDAVLLLKNVASAERINMGDFKVAPRRHDLSNVLRRAIEKRALVFEKAYGVKIELVGFPVGALGLVDPFLLQRAIENVLVNACRYSPPGEVVTVSAACRGNKYVVSVRDRGPGIPPEFSEAVFEEFFTVPLVSASSVSAPRGGQEPGGSGLGLFIAREIVNRHNGSIRIDANNRKGCRVIISLPILTEGGKE